MVDVPKKFKLNVVCTAVITVLSTGAIAQENNAVENANNAEDAVEVIEIQGLKSSLKKSINDKRFADGIVDTINAEDIGKNTDQNIADALGRVTGVSIVERDGEGSQITIRGATEHQNNISLNGQQLTSTDFSQAVDLSTFSSGILSKLEVIKTPSANHDEGSLGGSVNLSTIKALDQSKNIRAFEFQGRYGDFTEKTNYKAQFSLTEAFLDNTFGVAFTAYKETNDVRRDQYRVGDFEESKTISLASDQNGGLISDVVGIVNQSTNYELIENSTDRQGVTLGLQWLPTDDSELTFDVTYTQEERTRAVSGVTVRETGANTNNFVEGERPLTNFENLVAPYTDPLADWTTVDTDTYTITKYLQRFAAGDLIRSEGGNDTDNFSATLKYDVNLTDDFNVSFQAGHSFSKSESLPNAFTVMQNNLEISRPLIFETSAEDIQPVGYDCTSGQCRLVSGTAFADLGTNVNGVYTDANGALQPQWRDNTNVVTGFNPADLDTFTLGFIGVNQSTVEDKLSNAQLDFTYDFELGPVTGIEFGAKVTQRDKDVDDQQFRFTTATQTSVLVDDLGNRLVVTGSPLSNVRGSNIPLAGGLPYDNFLDSLGFPRNATTEGWNPIDAIAARDLVLDDENTIPNIDRTRTRSSDIDTQAAYLKANFEFLDGRLKGDIGLRYVKTDIEGEGFAGANFWSFDNEDLSRETDLVHLRELRDTSLPACSPLPEGPLSGYQIKFARVDGLGYDTSSGTDASQWTRTPDQGPCHDPDYALFHSQVNDDIPDADQDIAAFTWVQLWRYADVSTSHSYIWNGGITHDGSQVNDFDTVGFIPETIENRRQSSFPTTGKHSYENVLPSLNLSYAVSDEFVARFAVSKTMTRPEIDLIRPGFEFRESGYWGDASNELGSTLTAFNTKLEPLESNNLDLSLEWYFSPTGLLSVAFYSKDMKNFTSINSDVVHIKDLRTFTETVEDPRDLVLIPDSVEADPLGDNSLAGCQPVRATALGLRSPLANTDDLRQLCQLVQFNLVENGAGAKINGLEFGYSQTYDFLPGIFSGLGVSANYTFQDSKYDAETSSITGVKLPEYPVANTPKHTYNLTGFWEGNGHQIRLSYRGTSDSLVGTDWNTGLQGRTWNQGSIWNEGRDVLDLSLSYKVSDNVSLTFQATNLTDSNSRTYFTSRTLNVLPAFDEATGNVVLTELLEGNPLEGDAPKSRTYTNFKTGRNYRLSVRVNF